MMTSDIKIPWQLASPDDAMPRRRMTKEQIEARLNSLIDEIVDAERDAADAAPGQHRHLRNDAKAVRERVMDTLMEIYIG